ncbi:T9SS type A sorting domain-containing protein [Algibacter sp. AS12]|uniref:T9SS type A sorting domain-containing protein n=1 Tax=Algibacter sp. AS12 TaxID=3135773 RepID=UPI00398A923D
MKKLYSSILLIFAFTIFTSGQTIFSSDFTTTDYTTGLPQTNLNDHPDWKAGHFGNANTWVAFTTANPKDVIRTQAAFTYAIVDSKPIIAVNTDVITIKISVDLGFNGQTYGTTAGENLCFLGLLNQNNPTAGSEANVRDGVMIANQAAAGKLALTNNNQGNGSAFDVASGILNNELNARTYEVIIEYTIGSDAASSSKKAKIESLLGTEGSSTTTVSTAMNPAVYTALTGTGAYFMDWALNFARDDSAINTMQINNLEITKNSPLLSTRDLNAFEFNMYPNPVKNLLHINTLEPLQKIEIFDLLGKSVLTTTNVRSSIDVSSLNRSLYIIKLTSDNGVATKKFIKK